MNKRINPTDVTIRTELRPGDIGYVVHLHGSLYKQEYDYGIGFESYVAAGLHEFWQQYDPAKDRVWIAEHEGKMIGFLLLMHRAPDTAQLRYFLLDPAYRGIGLGKRLIQLYMEFYRSCGYKASYLWTTSELDAAASLYKRQGFRLVEEKPSDAFGKAVVEQKYQL
jgi:GNAT superfamily N-acetyltransferase